MNIRISEAYKAPSSFSLLLCFSNLSVYSRASCIIIELNFEWYLCIFLCLSSGMYRIVSLYLLSAFFYYIAHMVVIIHLMTKNDEYILIMTTYSSSMNFR